MFEFATLCTAAIVWAVWPFAKGVDGEGDAGQARRFSSESGHKLTA